MSEAANLTTDEMLERHMQAPAQCRDCNWLGKFRDLIFRGSDPHGTMPRCPECKSANTRIVQSDGSGIVQ